MAHRFASSSGLASQALHGSSVLDFHVSASTTMTRAGMVFATASTADITITLPPAASCPQEPILVKKVAGNYAVKVVPQGADRIDSVSLITLLELMAAYTLYSDGAAWHLT